MLQNVIAHFKQDSSCFWSSINASNYAAPRFPLANHFYFLFVLTLGNCFVLFLHRKPTEATGLRGRGWDITSSLSATGPLLLLL